MDITKIFSVLAVVLLCFDCCYKNYVSRGEAYIGIILCMILMEIIGIKEKL